MTYHGPPSSQGNFPGQPPTPTTTGAQFPPGMPQPGTQVCIASIHVRVNFLAYLTYIFEWQPFFIFLDLPLPPKWLIIKTLYLMQMCNYTRPRHTKKN